MDPLTYILAAFIQLDAKARWDHQLLINSTECRIVRLSFSSAECCEILEDATAPNLPALAAKVPKIFKRYGIDYPAFS